MILVLDACNLCRDICKSIFVILELQSHYEWSLSKIHYLELFYQHGLYVHHAFTEALFNLFWTLTVVLTTSASWKSYKKNWYFVFPNTKCHSSFYTGKKNWYQIWVTLFTNNLISLFGGSQQVSTFAHFLYFFVILLTLLAYSAMVHWVGRSFEQAYFWGLQLATFFQTTWTNSRNSHSETSEHSFNAYLVYHFW